MTALLAVAGQAFGAMVSALPMFGLARLHVRIVTSQATEFAGTFPEAAASLHSGKVIQEVGLLLLV